MNASPAQYGRAAALANQPSPLGAAHCSIQISPNRKIYSQYLSLPHHPVAPGRNDSSNPAPPAGSLFNHRLGSEKVKYPSIQISKYPSIQNILMSQQPSIRIPKHLNIQRSRYLQKDPKLKKISERLTLSCSSRRERLETPDPSR